MNHEQPMRELIASCSRCTPSAQLHILTPDGPKCKRCLAAGRKPPQTTDQPLPKWDVIDSRTGERVAGPFASKTRARRIADERDNQYGAYRYYAAVNWGANSRR